MEMWLVRPFYYFLKRFLDFEIDFHTNMYYFPEKYGNVPQLKTFRKTRQILTSSLTKKQRDSPMGVGISRKYMVGFEGLWAHNNFWNFFGPELSFENDFKIRF